MWFCIKEDCPSYRPINPDTKIALTILTDGRKPVFILRKGAVKGHGGFIAQFAHYGLA
jgi:hypothetical protein